MKEQRSKSSLSFYLQILVLLAVFLAVSMVLIQVFAAARRMSRAARSETEGVTLCRSAAEAFAAGGDTAGTAALLGAAQQGDTLTVYYDERLAPLPAASGGWAYCLTLTAAEQAQTAGTLRSAHITVCSAAGAQCAALDTEAYRPAQEGGGADGT